MSSYYQLVWNDDCTDISARFSIHSRQWAGLPSQICSAGAGGQRITPHPPLVVKCFLVFYSHPIFGCHMKVTHGCRQWWPLWWRHHHWLQPSAANGHSCPIRSLRLRLAKALLLLVKLGAWCNQWRCGCGGVRRSNGASDHFMNSRVAEEVPEY